MFNILVRLACSVRNIQQTTNENILYLQKRSKWVNHRMKRDAKRRQVVTEYAPMRLRVNALRRNDILPPELQEIATTEINEFPRDSNLLRLHSRCVITSKPRSNVHRWRVSRIIFRHLADYNKLAGVQRAMW